MDMPTDLRKERNRAPGTTRTCDFQIRMLSFCQLNYRVLNHDILIYDLLSSRFFHLDEPLDEGQLRTHDRHAAAIRAIVARGVWFGHVTGEVPAISAPTSVLRSRP